MTDASGVPDSDAQSPPARRMLITVAICTWNRSVQLEQTLASLARCRVPEDSDWEVIVVANNCTDDTMRVLEAAARRLPMRVVDEPQLGLSHARNTAVDVAAGSYIVWTDDDVIVEPEWLEAYARAFRADPDAEFFGGPIRAWFDSPPPAWVAAALPNIGNAFSLVEYGPEFEEFHVHALPFGANFAIRTDVQRRVRYDPALGRHGTELRSGEETAVLVSILAAGGRGRWVPDAAVLHHVGSERQSIAYLRRYYFQQALAEAMTDPAPGRLRVMGIPLWLWREAVEHELRYWLTRPLGVPALWSRHLRRASTAWGQIYGERLAARRARAQAASVTA